MAAFCLSSVKCVVTRASTPPGLRASIDLAKKKSCSDSFCPRYSSFTSAKGTLPMTRVDATLGQARVAEVLDADVLVGMECLGDAAGDGVQFDADEAHPSRGHGS